MKCGQKLKCLKVLISQSKLLFLGMLGVVCLLAVLSRPAIAQ